MSNQLFWSLCLICLQLQLFFLFIRLFYNLDIVELCHHEFSSFVENQFYGFYLVFRYLSLAPLEECQTEDESHFLQIKLKQLCLRSQEFWIVLASVHFLSVLHFCFVFRLRKPNSLLIPFFFPFTLQLGHLPTFHVQSHTDLTLHHDHCFAKA